MERKEVLFSIICPFFNGERFLDEAIYSVLIQTCPDWELILVDDGSTDNSYRVVAPYFSENVHYYKNENHGVLYSRYFGVSKSVGKYIVFLDCDDLLPNNALEIYKIYIEQHNPDVIFSDTSAFSVEGYNPRIYHNKTFQILSNNNTYHGCYFDNRYGYYHNAACFKRDLFENHILPDLFRNHVYTEDLIDTYFLIKDANSIVLLTEVLYLYRKHGESKSKANMSATDYYQAFLSYNYIYEDINKEYPYSFQNLSLELKKELSAIPMYYFVFNGKKDCFSIFKKRASTIRNSFLYQEFSKNFKFTGKRYLLIKILLFLRLYRLLHCVV